MADTFVSVTWVADELVTSTKLNQAMANQANFHNGTALGDGIIVTRHLGSAANLQVPLANVAGLTWSTFTPTLTNMSIGNGTLTGRYIQIGKTVHYFIGMLLGSTTSISGAVSVALPVNARSNYTYGATKEGAVVGNVAFLKAGSQIYYGVFQIRSNDVTKADPMAMVASGTYVTFANMTASIPVALGNGDAVYISGSYECT